MSQQPEDRTPAVEMPAEAQVLKMYYAEFVQLITVPLIASKFYSKGIISREVLEHMISGNGIPMEKKMKLLTAVIDHVTVNPEKFVTVVEIFKEESTLTEITGKLVETHSELF